MSDIAPASENPPLNDVGELPLAPPVVPVAISPEKKARQERFATRMWCAFVLGMCAAMMAVALKLDPNKFDARYPGTGTHEQLGLPPCGMLAATGYPCPTCGCTTAVSNFAHGNILRSLLTQPFGFAVALLATLLIPLTFIGVMSGKWMGPSMFWLSWHWQYWVYGAIGLLVLGWIYKIMVIRMHISV